MSIYTITAKTENKKNTAEIGKHISETKIWLYACHRHKLLKILHYGNADS